jgi:hypothetical protein
MVTRDLLSLSKLLGHSSIKQTEHYAKVTSNSTQEQFRAYDESSRDGIGKVLKFEAQAG